ncbi:hypothetical protein QZH41_013910 [Actinostola sp. cb2023]|nr:hypothetical protein QZH41_013910 [Actinostola sp. cb2023]
MYSSRTRAKNILLGQRICAPWKDGLYYSGAIEAVKSRPTGESTFTILFDDGYIAEVDEEDIVGPSFAKASSVNLQAGQRVYVTYHGREVPGKVMKSKSEWKKLVVRVLDHGEHLLTVKKDEIRLLKGQKLSTDVQFEANCDGKECPIPCKIKAQGFDFEQSPSKHQENVTRSEEMAALVLTALSISPVLKEQESSFKEDMMFSPSPDSGTEMASASSPSLHTNSLSNSPICSTSPSSLDELKYNPLYHIDEGIELEFVKKERTRKRKNSTSSTGSVKKVIYLCTWPGCGKSLSTVQGIIRHVRTIHLEPKRHSEDGFSDGEEEFYFTEQDDDLDDFCDPFPHPLALSPTPTQSHFDMVKSPWSEPCGSPAEMLESSENSPQNLRFNWDFHISDQTNAAKAASTTRSSQPIHHRKLRGESKKCRKVYGMDNRHLWCTQCRWKKACVRFSDC